MMQFVARRSGEATLKLRLKPAELLFAASFKSPFQYLCYATSTASNAGSNLMMVDYLVNTIGLSRDEAISASPKVSHLKSTKNSDLILNLLKTYGGLDQTLIRNVVSSVPQVLLLRADQTLELKFRAYRDLGLSGSNLVNLIKIDRDLYKRGLDSHIIPTLTYLRDLLGNDENVLKVINKCTLILKYKLCRNFQPNMLLLESYGVPKDMIAKLVIQYPKVFIQEPEWLRSIVLRVDKELGISRNTRMFGRGIIALSHVSGLTLEKKRDVFRSFGWSDSDISTLFRTLPVCINISEAKLHDTLNFAMKELGHTPAYLVARPVFFTLSLETRVKPRHKVVKLLEGMKQVKVNASFYTLLRFTELKFVKFLTLYKDEAPNLLEIYHSSIKSKSNHTRRAINKTSAENLH